jgi:predicted phosphodiesterase
MIYAVFSDIHANNTALEAVLSDISRHRPDRMICLGDIVGYCASPHEVIEKSQAFHVVLMGNHDFAVNNKALTERFNFHARVAMEWTVEQLSAAEKKYLSKLYYQHFEADATFVHATPRDPESWGYIMDIEDALDAFNYFSSRLCFIGHTHKPFVVTDRGQVIMDSKIFFNESTRYLVNIGSVGQPRDSNPNAGYVLYDSEEQSIEFVRLHYNIARTQEQMIAARFPPFLIHRLSEGC